MSNRPNSQNLTQNIVQDLGVAVVAVKMLTAKGVLRARPRQGTWVQPEESWNMLDPDVLRWLLERKPWMELLIEFTQVRLAIEPGAAALAAQVAGPAEKAAVQQ